MWMGEALTLARNSCAFGGARIPATKVQLFFMEGRVDRTRCPPFITWRKGGLFTTLSTQYVAQLN